MTRGVLAALLASLPAVAAAEAPLPEAGLLALAEEMSGESAKRNLEVFSQQHRMRGSGGFRAAADHVVTQLRAYGLAEAQLLSFPTDGKTFYGTQKGRLAWDAELAELWDLPQAGAPVRLASWDAMPLVLAQDSESADVTADLVDVGAGTADADYAGKDVKGRLVLVSAQPDPVAALAVARHGAAGIVSYAQNQKTAWWGEDENLVSLKQARALQERLRRGERVRLHAVVKAGQHPGAYDIPTVVLPGRDPARRGEEVVFSCHLDHPRPGANDNASGCAAILEVARTLAKLVREGKLEAPARSLRFVWPPEIEGTLALLNGRPGWAARVKAAVHLDMVGGGPVTKAVFHVTRGPASLPSFVHDVAAAYAERINRETEAFAAGRASRLPLAAPEGGKEALQAEVQELTLGSDHQVYQDSSFGIPAVYLNDWPDRYIHTNFDSAANVDPTKLKRAAFLAAATGYFLANLGPEHADEVWRVLEPAALRRAAGTLEAQAGLPAGEAASLRRFRAWHERGVVDSVARFFPPPSAWRERVAVLSGLAGPVPSPTPPRGPVYRRNPAVKGPMTAFGYDYFTDHYGSDRAAQVRLLKAVGARGAGAEYAYEVLNLVDGRRTTSEIHEAVSAVYGPLPLDVVEEYLAALAEIRAVLPAGR
jgi:aminopeptidase YwaD